MKRRRSERESGRYDCGCPTWSTGSPQPQARHLTMMMIRLCLIFLLFLALYTQTINLQELSVAFLTNHVDVSTPSLTISLPSSFWDDNDRQAHPTSLNSTTFHHLSSNYTPVPSFTDMQVKGGALARSFYPSNNANSLHSPESAYWCTQKNSKKRRLALHGMLYVKVPKVASTTLASVVNRIARHQHARQYPTSHNDGMCPFRNTHVPGSNYQSRSIETSFLLGSVRDPAARALSRIFWTSVTQKGAKPTDAKVRTWLNYAHRHYGSISTGQGGFQLQYLSLQGIAAHSAWHNTSRDAVHRADVVEQHVQAVLEDYDFMVVVERMDESLVALQLLLNVPVGDVLTLDSKVQGNYQYFRPKHGGGGKKRKQKARACLPIAKATKSPAIQAYFESSVWRAQNYGDYLLWSAANASLDRTIEAVGRTRFDAALAEYRKLKGTVTDVCTNQTAFQCSSDGVPQPEKAKLNCYVKDQGCGYPCIDQLLLSGASVPSLR